MTVCNKGPEIVSTIPKVQACEDSEINVVTYDEEQQPLPEVQATAIDEQEESSSQQLLQQAQHRSNYPHPHNSSSSSSYQNNINTDTASANHRQPYQPPSPEEMEEEENDSFDCLLCGDTILCCISAGANISLSLLGNTYIDIHDSQFASGAELYVWIVRLVGNVRVLVPPGTRVVIRRLLLCGNRDIHIEQQQQQQQQGINNEQEAGTQRPLPPRIILTILSLCGNVRIRSDPEDL